MIRRTIPLLVILLVSSAGCDSEGTVVLVPEFEESFDFESSLQGWAGASDGLSVGTTVSIEHVSGSGAAGQGFARISTSAEDAGGRVWIARAFQVSPEQAYEVTVTFALGTADAAATTPWDVLSGSGPTPPGPAGLVVRGSTAPESPTGQRVWETRTHTLVVTSGTAEPGGETAPVWIALGLGVSTAGDREYGLDEIEVSFLRTN